MTRDFKPKITFRKQAHKLPPFSELQTDIPYAISLNPINQYDHKMLITRFKDLVAECCHMTRQLNFCDVELRPELSSGNRFHYHGYLWIKDKIRFISNDLQYLIKYGTYCIEPITDVEWSMYIRKDRHLMIPFLHEMKLKYKISSYDSPLAHNHNLTLHSSARDFG